MSGCVDNWPQPLFLDTEIDYGPPEYRQGYADGCESGLSRMGNSFYKAMHTFKQDPYLINNSKLYERAWKDAHLYCWVWLWQWKKHNAAEAAGAPGVTQ